MIPLLLVTLSVAGCAKSFSLFYQPQAGDFNTTDWEARIAQLHDEGGKSLILQWSRYGSYDFDAKHPRWLTRLFDAARKAHIGIYVGLYSDPAYFQKLQTGDLNTTRYLHTLYLEQAKTVMHLREKVAGKSAFSGWYMPEEIDDLVWQSPQREEALRRYLQKMAQLLEIATPDKEVCISAFFAAHSSPQQFAKTLERTIPEKWTLLLQSGVGAGLVTEETCERYMRYFQQHYRGRWRPVIELFSFHDQNPEANFAVLKAQEGCFSDAPVLFSWRYYFDHDFHTHYLQSKKGLL